MGALRTPEKLMDVSKIERIVRSLGSRTEVRVNKVRCNCLLAPWTHPKGRDQKPSMVILQGQHGDPIYTCLGCHETGTFRDLLCFLWMRTGINMLRHIEVLDGESDRIPENVDTAVRKVRKRVRSVSYERVRRKALEKKLSDDDGSKPWHSEDVLRKSEEVEEIPWSKYEPYLGSVPQYALERGLTIETCREWELGHDKRMKRLLFPMRDRKGRLVAISGRLYADDCPRCRANYITVEDGIHPLTGEVVFKEVCASCNRTRPPKYLHNNGFDRNLHLYGEHRVQDGRKCAYVVEGNLDVVKLWQAGYRPVVGLLGSHPGAAQVEKLIAYYDRVIVVPDADKAGDGMVTELDAGIAWRIPIAVRRPPEGKDPGDLSVEELRELLGEPGRFRCCV